jgi:GNAT superfamily N-acetyltransferase
MTDIDVLRAWSDENLLAGFDVLARHPPRGAAIAPRRFGTVIAYANGRRYGFFNPVVILAPTTAGPIEAAVRWVRELGMAVTLRVREDVDDEAVRAATGALGLDRHPWVERGMVQHPLGIAPDPPPGLRIETATPGTLERWHRASAVGFGLQDSARDLPGDLIPEGVARDPDVRLFGGFLGDESVASSLAIRSEHVVGVYSVGTMEAARRRGIGSAMAWAAVTAGREWGSEAAILQASEMGEPVYRAMGFQTVTGYVTYAAPRPDTSPTDAG